MDTFLQRVADRAGIPLERARVATDAVLETLAERIAGGEVDDLIARLHVSLKRAVGEEFTDVTVQLPGEYVALLAR